VSSWSFSFVCVCVKKTAVSVIRSVADFLSEVEMHVRQPESNFPQHCGFAVEAVCCFWV
jgi:pantoate kinase